MQPPFAARVHQPVDGQHLQHALPVGPLPTGRQPLTPERVQVQLLPQQARHPARPPLARSLQTELGQTHLHGLGDMRGHFSFQREEGQLGERLAITVEDLDGFDPGRFLAVVDLAQIQDRSLNPLVMRAANFLDDAPVAVILPVLEPVMRVQIRLAHSNGGQRTSAARWGGRG